MPRRAASRPPVTNRPEASMRTHVMRRNAAVTAPLSRNAVQESREPGVVPLARPGRGEEEPARPLGQGRHGALRTILRPRSAAFSTGGCAHPVGRLCVEVDTRFIRCAIALDRVPSDRLAGGYFVTVNCSGLVWRPLASSRAMAYTPGVTESSSSRRTLTRLGLTHFCRATEIPRGASRKGRTRARRSDRSPVPRRSSRARPGRRTERGDRAVRTAGSTGSVEGAAAAGGATAAVATGGVGVGAGVGRGVGRRGGRGVGGVGVGVGVGDGAAAPRPSAPRPEDRRAAPLRESASPRATVSARAGTAPGSTRAWERRRVRRRRPGPGPGSTRS